MKDEHKNKILVYYPKTEYNILNKEILKKINNYITIFKSEITDSNVQKNQYYTLLIIYDSYLSKDYISYVFNIEYYTGGAHENHEIWTINYNIKKNKLISTQDLIDINSNTLNIFSNISRKELIKNSNITSTSMMLEGTTPEIKNFSNFVIFNSEIILFFPQYQVAPYSSGKFIVKVPYNKIFI